MSLCDSLFISRLAEPSTNLVGILDCKGLLRYQSPNCLAILGYEAEQLVGTRLFDLVHPNDLPAAEMVFQHILEHPDESGLPTLIRLRRKDGSWRYFQSQVRSVPDDPKASSVLVSSCEIAPPGLLAHDLRVSSLSMDLLPDIALWTDASGGVVKANAAARKAFGWDPDQLSGKFLWDVDDSLRPNQWPAQWEHIKRMGSLQQESQLRKVGGTRIQTESNWSYIRSDEEDYCFVVLRELKEKRRSEESLFDSERLFRETLQNANLGALMLDSTGHILYANEHFRLITGRSNEDIVGLDWFEYFVPLEIRDKARKTYCERFENGQTPPQCSDYILTQTGERLRIEWDCSTIRDRLGRPIGLAGIGRDITERVRAEKSLRRSQSSLIHAQSVAKIGSWEEDLSSGHISWTGQVYHIFGRDPATFVPTKERFYECVHPEDRDKVRAAFAKSAATGNHYVVEHRAVRPDGTQIYVLERGEIVVNEQEGEIRLIGTVQDITDRRIIEEKLEKLNTALTRSNEDLDQFAYAVSHDLQEPLRTIISHADLLMRKTGGESEEVREICAELRDSSVRMKTLITDLLTYSRVSHSPDQVFRPVDLTAVLKWTVMNLSAAIKESNAQVQFENLPRVMGDDTLLVQVFQNLIGNSIKFRAQDPPVIRITAEPQGSMWVISVQDNGLGIDAQHAERIFKLFKRLHGREFPGNGIGLGICKKIIERHGGQIWVESQPNRGANFRFTCPDAT